jgi:UDP-glucuronate decarboxylase
MIELATEVLRLTGSESVLLHETLPEDDPKQRKPDISLAQREFDWAPNIELVEGLKRTITEFNSRIASSDS